MLNTRIMNDEDKQTICSWSYPNEYEIYNMPSYQTMKENQSFFLNPLNEDHYNAYLNGDELVGFTNIVEEDHEVFIGIGVKPDVCGKGYGQEILKLTIQKCKNLYGNKPLYLEVRTWNKRAVNCYLKAGFVIDGDEIIQTTHIGEGRFYRMIYKHRNEG